MIGVNHLPAGTANAQWGASRVRARVLVLEFFGPPLVAAQHLGLDIFSIQDKRVPIAVGIIIGVGIGIRIEGQKMGFGHGKPDVYRTSIAYVGWVYRFCETLKDHRNAKDQLLRASQAIPLNIAEGNGKATDGDRRRYFVIARGSALECGAIQDVLQVCGALSPEGRN